MSVARCDSGRRCFRTHESLFSNECGSAHLPAVNRSAAQDLRPLTPARRHNAEHLTFSTPSANLYEENDHSLWSSSFTSQQGPYEVGLLFHWLVLTKCCQDACILSAWHCTLTAGGAGGQNPAVRCAAAVCHCQDMPMWLTALCVKHVAEVRSDAEPGLAWC